MMHRALLLLAILSELGSSAAGLAAGSGNATNDRMLALPPEQQALLMTKGIKGCAGTTAFPMGVTTTGKAKGYAYWSVRCKDGRSFVIQIAPNADWMATDCGALEGTGKECFKKF
jgi:hypothetical protein